MFFLESIQHARESAAHEEDLREAVRQLSAVRRRSAEIRSTSDPAALGLPDLLFPLGLWQGVAQCRDGVWTFERSVAFPETEESWWRRRDAAVKELTESYLIVEKDNGERRPVVLYAKALRVVSDVFYGRVRFVVIWAARGSGKSLAIGVLLFLLAVYRSRSVLDVAGSQDQALQVYKYVMSFVRSVAKVGERFLIKPLRDRASFANGAQILCVAASEKAVRGKHFPVLVIDEACQDEGDAQESSKVMRSALQGPLSEPDSIALAFSTWHAVSDFFEDLWNKAEERGFTRYTWDVYDVMARCTEGLQDPFGGHYPPNHPEAVRACEGCFLTEVENVIDPGTGHVVGRKRVGCFDESLGFGRARLSDGWQSFEATCHQKRINLGTDKFAVEFENRRPTKGDPVYNLFQVDNARSEHEFEIYVSRDWPSVFGVDWGWATGRCAVIHVLPYGEMLVGYREPVIHGLVAVAECFMGSVNHTHVDKEMRRMEREAGIPEGSSEVYADSRQPADNLGLHEGGWTVRGVDFQIVKESLITNLGLYLAFGRFKMVARATPRLHSQMRGYHRDHRRKPVKKDDHGCDGAAAALARFPFVKLFRPE